MGQLMITPESRDAACLQYERNRHKPRDPRLPHLLIGLWTALLLVPLLVMLHQELHTMGPHAGWQVATLEPHGYLYAWTRNRLIIWAGLYVVGALLLWRGLCRDRDGGKLRDFSETFPGRLAISFSCLLLILGGAFLEPSEVALLGMAVAGAFFWIWGSANSGVALARVSGKLMCLTVCLGLVFLLGEFGMRMPTVVQRTGGSPPFRSRLFDDIHQIPEASRKTGLLWRDRHHAQPKPKNTIRILTLGDSFTWGQWVSDYEDVWPNVLEDDLKKQGYAVQVVNAGANGTSPRNHADCLETLGWLLEPDVLILQYTLNDAGSPYDEALPLLPVVGNSLARTSCLYNFLDSRFKAMQFSLFKTDGYNPYFEESSAGWQASQRDVREIVQQAKEHGVPVLFVLFPMLDSTLDESQYRHLKAHEAIKQVMSEMGVQYVDVRGDLARINADPQTWWAQAFDAHPNAAAHRVAAEAITSALMATKWIDQRRAVAKGVGEIPFEAFSSR